MLIKIINTPTLIPTNEILGTYQVSFEFVQVGNVNDASELSKLNLQFNYLTSNEDGTDIQHTKTIG
jgi:hypothetical protein